MFMIGVSMVLKTKTHKLVFPPARISGACQCLGSQIIPVFFGGNLIMKPPKEGFSEKHQIKNRGSSAKTKTFSPEIVTGGPQETNGRVRNMANNKNGIIQMTIIIIQVLNNYC